MSTPKAPAETRAIQRGNKDPNPLGTTTFISARLLEPLLQYQILKHALGATLITHLHGQSLPQGPPLITRTPLDHLGLSPYRTILLAMSVGSTLKHTYWVSVINQERVLPQLGIQVGIINSVFNSLNSLLFICAQTSASTNGEHFPQTPLIVGTVLYGVGLGVEVWSEQQRFRWKKDTGNKGKVYTGGLWSLARHINYFGYTLWRTGYAIAAGGWLWGAFTASSLSVMFLKVSVPELQQYMAEKYGEQFKRYQEKTPYAYIPFVY